VTVRLRGITWEHERGHGSVVAAAAAFRAVRPHVEIEWSYRSLQAFADEPLEVYARTVDLLVIDHPHVAHAVEAGLLLALDDTGHDTDLDDLERHAVGRSHESYRYLGRQWGLASDAAAQVAAVRPDQVSDPPTDWDAVLELAGEGRVAWPYKPIDAFSSLVTVAGGQGEAALHTPGTFLSIDALEPALDLLCRLADRVDPRHANSNPIQVADDLSSDSRAVYAPLLFGYSNYSRAGYRPHRLRYLNIPDAGAGVRGSLLGGAGIAVSAFTAHPHEAVAHAFWLASAPTQCGAYFIGGGQPGHAAAWDDDDVNAATLDFFRGTRATLESAYLRPRHPRYIELQDAAGLLIHRAILDRTPATQLAPRLDELSELIAGG
jgi:multiple sugar transport system substrate-binding protein